VRAHEPPAPQPVDLLYQEVLKAGEDLPRMRRLVGSLDLEELTLLALLRRSVPVRFLEVVATLPLVTERPRLQAAVTLNRRAPRPLSLKLLPNLFWRDLAEVALTLRVPGPVRHSAEALLKEKLPEMRSGERIALARIATPPLMDLLLQDPDPRILAACLENAHLREEDLHRALRRDVAPVHLLEEVARSPRWGDNYATRVVLLLQPRTPLPVGLSLLSSLVKADLRRLASTEGLAPLLRIAAQRLEAAPGGPGPAGGRRGLRAPRGRG
jgi:hypothetical protein